MQTQTRQYTAALKACCFLVGLGVAFESQAEWFESTGYAVIDDGDIAKARHAAIKDAVRQALIFSGASVSSVQTIADGVLSQRSSKN
ncbi:flagellar assembly protein T N-terminal domain-containing protein [Pseudoalteromonas xiamenensis]